MVWAVILGILFGVGMLVCAGIAIWGAMDEGTVRKCVGGIFAPILFILFLCIPFSFHQVDAGEVAVVKHMGDVSGVRTAGTYFDFWMTEKYERYDAKVQTLEITDSAYSKDAQTMDIQMTVQYQIDTAKVKEIAVNYGNLEALSNRIRSVAIEKTKSVLSSHRAMNETNNPDSDNGIIENREKVGQEVTRVVTDALDGYYILVNTVALTNIDFSDAFEATVEQKMIAEQEQLKAQYEKEKAIIKAEQDLEVAKKAADAALYQANKDAEAKKAIALAEAVATSSKIAKLAESLGYDVTEQTSVLNKGTDDEQTVITGYVITWPKDADNKVDDSGKTLILEYLKYLEYLATWNGELPNVVAGDNSLELLIPSTSVETPTES